MGRVLFLLVIAVSLAGCMVGPDYKRPVVEAPQSFRFEPKEVADTANTQWWKQFDDPVLEELIHIALRENKDVLIAAARVEQFIGQYRTTRAALFPQISAGAVGERSRTTSRGNIPLSPAVENPYNTFEIFLNASWEIDFWGKFRRATEAARANLLSTEEGRRVVILTLVTSVANSYINLRDLDQQLEIARRTAKSRGDSYRLFESRFRGGVISRVELSQVKSLYEEAQSVIPVIQKAIAQQENLIQVLLGRNPGPVPRGKTVDELVLPAVPAGLPSSLLVNRPDIRQVEQNLIAANASIGVAKAQYYPTISLTAFFGYASTELHDLFTGPARVWSYGVPLAAPVFTGGAIAGQVKAAEGAQQQALLQYQQTIQNAFREVEDSLADQANSREELASQGRQIDALRTYERLARRRFENGYTSYLEVLDAERSLFSAELSRAQTKGALFQALVNVYKAMGGGWVIEADQMTGQKMNVQK